MSFIKRNEKEEYDKQYRTAEAMYFRGCDAREISRTLSIEKWKAIDLMQRIFYRTQASRL